MGRESSSSEHGRCGRVGPGRNRRGERGGEKRLRTVSRLLFMLEQRRCFFLFFFGKVDARIGRGVG